MLEGEGIDRALGIQATAADLTPGSIELLVTIRSGEPLDAFSIAYQLHVRNDSDRQSRIRFSYGLGLEDALIAVPRLDHLTPGSRTPESRWFPTPIQATFASTVAVWSPEQILRLRWDIEDHAGSGSRDELALDNLVVSGSALSEPGSLGMLLLGIGSLVVTVRRPRLGAHEFVGVR